MGGVNGGGGGWSEKKKTEKFAITFIEAPPMGV